ncbi:MAG: CehA/McbA family metallohydrolase [Candidatus Altiarchaeota archaeon]
MTTKIFFFSLLCLSILILTVSAQEIEYDNIIFSVSNLHQARNLGRLPIYLTIINNGTSELFIENISISFDDINMIKEDLDTIVNISNSPQLQESNNNTCSSYAEFKNVFSRTYYINLSEIDKPQLNIGKTINISVLINYIKDNQGEKVLLNSSFSIYPKFEQTISEKEYTHSKQISASGGWKYGDLHIHTNYTNCDASIYNGVGTVADRRDEAITSGLNWISITDHSYCMTSTIWNNFKNDCHNADSSSFLILHSEELSVDESCPSETDNENWCCKGPTDCTVCGSADAGHMNAHGISSFVGYTKHDCFTGSTGRCPDEPDSQDGIDDANNNEGLAIINHPFNSEWDWASLSCVSDYTGLEIWNGEFDSKDQDTIDYWIDELLDGEKIYGFSGSDSENAALFHEKLFGEDKFVYLGCYLSSFTEDELKSSLENGRCFISNDGGYALFYISSPSHTADEYPGGEIDVCSGSEITIDTYYSVVNSCDLHIVKGYIGGSSESTEKDYGWVSGSGSYTWTDTPTGDGYYRLTCLDTTNNNRTYTNPIWFNVIDSPDTDSDGTCDNTDTDDDNDSSLDVYDCADTNANVYEGSLSGTQVCCDGSWQCGSGRDSECYDQLPTCSYHAKNCYEKVSSAHCNGACQTCGSDGTCSGSVSDFSEDLTSPGYCFTQQVCYGGSCLTDTDDDYVPNTVDKDDDDDSICDYAGGGSYDTCSGNEETSSCDTNADCDYDGSTDNYDCWDTDITKEEVTKYGTQICCNGALKCTSSRSTECYVDSLMACTNHAENCAEYGITTQCTTACRTCGTDRRCSLNIIDGTDDSTSPGTCTSYNVCYYGTCYSDNDEDNIPNFLDLQVATNTPNNNTWDTDGSVQFNFTSTSAQQSTFACYLLVDGIVVQTKTGVANNTQTVFAQNLSEGTHTWNVNCTDGTANWDTDDNNRIIKIDTRPPTLSLGYPANGDYYTSSTVVFNYTAQDTVDSTVNCNLYFDGALYQTRAVNNGTDSLSKTSVADGNHTWYVNCTDDAGWSNQSTTWLIKLDANPPNITLNWPPNDIWYNNNTILFNYTVSDTIGPIINCSMALNGTQNQTTQALANNSNIGYLLSNLPEGPIYWNITCTDDATNTGNQQRIIKVDTVAPERPTEFDAWFNSDGTITLNWTNSESDDVISYHIHYSNSTAFNFRTVNANLTNSTNGWTDSTASSSPTRYYLVRSNDRAQNTDNNTYVIGKIGTLSLNSGWNIITPTHNRAEDALDQISGCTRIAEYINNGTTTGFLTHNQNTPLFNFTINPGKSYYVYCENNATIPVLAGSLASITSDVYAGWNLIGWTSFSNTTAQQLIENITNAAAVGQYVYTGQQSSPMFIPPAFTSITATSTSSNNDTTFQVHVDGSAENNFTIAAGKGYFVYLMNTSNWTVGGPYTTTTTINILPTVTLNSPADNYNSSGIFTFNFIAYDDVSMQLNCSLYINNTINQTRTVANNTWTNITLVFQDCGSHTWSIRCSDTDGGENSSETRTITAAVSYSFPSFPQAYLGYAIIDGSPIGGATITADAVTSNYQQNVTSSNTTGIYTIDINFFWSCDLGQGMINGEQIRWYINGFLADSCGGVTPCTSTFRDGQVNSNFNISYTTQPAQSPQITSINEGISLIFGWNLISFPLE